MACKKCKDNLVTIPAGAPGPQGVPGIEGPQGPQGDCCEKVTILNGTDSDITVDAASFDILLWSADFTANRKLNIDNYTPNKELIVLIENRNTASISYSVDARNDTVGAYVPVQFVNLGDAPLTFININSGNIRGIRWLNILSLDITADGNSDAFIGKFN